MAAPDTTPAGLQAHARALAVAFDVRLIEAAQLRPDEALGLVHLRVALVAPIGDETTYAVALHEVGHLVAPTGFVRTRLQVGDAANLRRVEEAAAWAWARHYAIVWTPAMEAVATWAEGTYAAPVAAPPPAAPIRPAHRPTVDWGRFT